jgi:hypothetical protein
VTVGWGVVVDGREVGGIVVVAGNDVVNSIGPVSAADVADPSVSGEDLFAEGFPVDG